VNYKKQWCAKSASVQPDRQHLISVCSPNPGARRASSLYTVIIPTFGGLSISPGCMSFPDTSPCSKTHGEKRGSRSKDLAGSCMITAVPCGLLWKPDGKSFMDDFVNAAGVQNHYRLWSLIFGVCEGLRVFYLIWHHAECSNPQIWISWWSGFAYSFCCKLLK